tara:strand:- start:783 stop:2525 length:1743 start_codon:yes stop_codon:yes gene_type:complete
MEAEMLLKVFKTIPEKQLETIGNQINTILLTDSKYIKEEKNPDTIRIASWNMKHLSWKSMSQRCLDIIVGIIQEVDFIALQEIDGNSKEKKSGKHVVNKLVRKLNFNEKKNKKQEVWRGMCRAIPSVTSNEGKKEGKEVKEKKGGEDNSVNLRLQSECYAYIYRSDLIECAETCPKCGKTYEECSKDDAESCCPKCEKTYEECSKDGDKSECSKDGDKSCSMKELNAFLSLPKVKKKGNELPPRDEVQLRYEPGFIPFKGTPKNPNTEEVSRLKEKVCEIPTKKDGTQELLRLGRHTKLRLDAGECFERPPYVAAFRVKGPKGDKKKGGFTFAAINVHLTPQARKNWEIDTVANTVANSVKSKKWNEYVNKNLKNKLKKPNNNIIHRHAEICNVFSLANHLQRRFGYHEDLNPIDKVIVFGDFNTEPTNEKNGDENGGKDGDKDNVKFVLKEMFKEEYEYVPLIEKKEKGSTVGENFFDNIYMKECCFGECTFSKKNPKYPSYGDDAGKRDYDEYYEDGEKKKRAKSGIIDLTNKHFLKIIEILKSLKMDECGNAIYTSTVSDHCKYGYSFSICIMLNES